MKKLAAIASLLALTGCSCFNSCCEPCDPCPKPCCYQAPATEEKTCGCPQPHFWDNHCCNPSNYAL